MLSQDIELHVHIVCNKIYIRHQNVFVHVYVSACMRVHACVHVCIYVCMYISSFPLSLLELGLLRLWGAMP